MGAALSGDWIHVVPMELGQQGAPAPSQRAWLPPAPRRGTPTQQVIARSLQSLHAARMITPCSIRTPARGLGWHTCRRPQALPLRVLRQRNRELGSQWMQHEREASKVAIRQGRSMAPPGAVRAGK